MLPKWHALLGFVFAYIVYWFTSITIFQASLIFLSSVLIDFDHYSWYAIKKKDWNLKNAYYWNKALPKKHKPMMHIFHTIEFTILVGLLGFIWSGFFYIFIGMLFHSFSDIIEINYNKKTGCREFSFIKYLTWEKSTILEDGVHL